MYNKLPIKSYSTFLLFQLGRIPLHYANSASKPDNIWQLLIHAGSDMNAEDMDGKTPLYYLTNETEIQLPDKPQYFYNFYGPEGKRVMRQRKKR